MPGRALEAIRIDAGAGTTLRTINEPMIASIIGRSQYPLGLFPDFRQYRPRNRMGTRGTTTKISNQVARRKNTFACQANTGKSFVSTQKEFSSICLGWYLRPKTIVHQRKRASPAFHTK